MTESMSSESRKVLDSPVMAGKFGLSWIYSILNTHCGYPRILSLDRSLSQRTNRFLVEVKGFGKEHEGLN